MAPASGIFHQGKAMAFSDGRSHAALPGWSRTALASLVLLGMATPPAARAADPDVASLAREVAALREVVQHLQARVDRLEGHPAATEQPASGTPRPALQAASDAASRDAQPARPIAALQPGTDAPVASPEAQLRASWSKIRPGIDSDEVSHLLGVPTRRLRLDGRDAWYYSYPALGNGSVFFTDAGRVSSHQSPFGWGG